MRRVEAARLSVAQQHPEISTVFVAGLSGGRGVVPSDGRDAFSTSVAGYIGAWNALPATVQRIIVIYDTPKVLSTTGCLRRARDGGAPAGRRGVRRVAQARAGSRSAGGRGPVVASPRVQVVDLRRIFCDTRWRYQWSAGRSSSATSPT